MPKAGGVDPSLSAAEVGGAFVLQYYSTLTTDRENLHKYYKDESICSRGLEGASPDKITYAAGVEEIRDEIGASQYLQATLTEINSIHFQDSKQGGVLVLVLGYFVYAHSPKVHFAQTFLLDKQSDPYPGYFVLNDILRYISGQPEHSDVEVQPQAELPPPSLPPPQPPSGLPVPKGAAASGSDVQAEAEAQEPTLQPAKEAPAPAPAPAEEEEEEEVAEEGDAVEEGAAEAVEEEEAEVDEAPAEAAEEAEVDAAAAVAAAAPEEEPKRSWAAMAGKLGDGGGQLGRSKLQGFSLPPPAKAKATAKAASSTTPVLPPPTAAAKAKAKAAVAAEDAKEAGEVRLWLSRIPTDVTIENQEVLDCLKKLISDAGLTGRADLDRKDYQDWASVSVSSKEVAEMLVQHSKDKKILLRGKVLKAEEKSSKFPSNRRGNSNASGKGGSQGGEDGGDVKDGNAANRGSRRGKGGKGGSDAGGPSEKSAEGRSRGGGRKGGGGGGGSWKGQS